MQGAFYRTTTDNVKHSHRAWPQQPNIASLSSSAHLLYRGGHLLIYSRIVKHSPYRLRCIRTLPPYLLHLTTIYRETYSAVIAHNPCSATRLYGQDYLTPCHSHTATSVALLYKIGRNIETDPIFLPSSHTTHRPGFNSGNPVARLYRGA